MNHRPCRPATRLRAVTGVLAAVLAAVLAGACTRREPPPAPPAPPPMPTNRIDVPEAVRTNLGIRFVQVERRRVAATVRVPGHFELLPDARREHPAVHAGRVAIAVEPLQAVAAGDVLYRLDAPAWREQQRRLDELDSELAFVAAQRRALQPLLAAHQAHEQSLKQALGVVERRVQQLDELRGDVGGQAQALADARVQLAQLQAQLAEAAEQHTETDTRLARLDQQERAFTGQRAQTLAAAAAAAGSATPPTAATTDTLPVHARAAGVVERLHVADGAWVDTNAAVLTTVDPGRVRFRARVLQGELAALRDGLPCRLVPAAGTEPLPSVAGTLQLGAVADPQTRTLEVFVLPAAPAAFVRAGLAGVVTIETTTPARDELAIPREALVQDGLQFVFFRRAPGDPDRVVRVAADLGATDGRWVEVKSGLADGDEVVTDGAYELALASSAAATAGGHFHPDGTWHADDHK